jgi:hypothetical protein
MRPPEKTSAGAVGLYMTNLMVQRGNHMTQLAIAEMEKRGSGHVVQILTSLVDHAISGEPALLASLTKTD